ncbi:homeodomain-interacting protein kinase 2-like isoform X2 [Scomber scombrus]|uniref:Homeodomain-interacting protein kinase 2-like isoform X2 n=1 Tax=Scomber scombrus TaxID=13677 RepID=A0AAV1MYY1_SCOSC
MVDRQHKGLSLREMSPVIHQLATALSHLRSMSIIHADLKPENIMVVNRQQRPLKVKTIDFGLARNVSAAKPGLILQTIWYRAPEIMLHIPFNEAIDMWSFGLVAVELATGHPLYPGKTDYEMLNLIMQTQGQPEDRMLDRGWRTDYYFHKQPNNQRMWAFKTPEEFSYETGIYPRETRRFTSFNPPHISVDMTDVEDEEPTVTWLPSSIQTSEPDQSLSDSEGTAPAAASPAAAAPAAPASGAWTRKRKRGKEMDVGEKERESLIQSLLIKSLQRAPATTTTTTCLERRGTFLKQSGSFPP